MRTTKLLAALAAATISTGAMAQAANEPAAPRLEFVFEEIVTLAPATQVGKTPLGGRLFIPITGGTFQGPDIKGTIVPGGWDWQLLRADGCTQVKADYMIKTDDGVVINVLNVGALCPPKDGKPSPVRTSPTFEAPIGKYDWLNRTAFVGTLDMAPPQPDGKPAVRIRFYKAV